MKEYIYLIDGVAVPRRAYLRRQLFGEHPGAKFESIRIMPKEPLLKKRNY